MSQSVSERLVELEMLAHLKINQLKNRWTGQKGCFSLLNLFIYQARESRLNNLQSTVHNSEVALDGSAINGVTLYILVG